jgi:Fur family transcriptional regulator, ferric uptake regulator
VINLLILIFNAKIRIMSVIRMTHQRKKILEAMHSSHEHLTAEMLYDNLKTEIPDLSLSTIYRSLKALADSGLISVSDLGDGLVFELLKDIPHHHLICLECHSIQPLDHRLVQPLFNQIQAQGFNITTAHLCLYGYCSSCQ